MKTSVLALTLSTLSFVSTFAQNAQSGKASLQTQPSKKGAEKMSAQSAKTPGKAEPSQVSFGGFAIDLAKSKKAAKPIDLRSPPKPKVDTDNVYTDPQTGAIKGFVLFAIKF